ncbi:formate dehydrogenase iron-sulfur subunit [Desulfonispora thiosulfatigenes DSM 11270]|uniref:Formate dehydrogenase iron-sulfur subunit n=1 Tax=Desulfonispora thiosulfatigenes DSM 11270 TaxID=656914 RepID=A0A1W1VFH4_DESTI|nr:4Fe-4S dicluster domain-containing protein [Desulfonispora thiosulfatigenes]SMB92102.1 formate dehydrogenase iron-sulfur subunit [Desulfonispora thiosulfatigenes DSM 11270]
MGKAVLVDITKCVGCGSCTVACKMWNDLKYEKDSPVIGEKTTLNSKTWTTISHKKIKKDGKEVWRFVKNQCMHCVDPACASACITKALSKNPDGSVVYNPSVCVGCRYCMLACPFEVPKYEWNKVLPNVAKCQMCSTKIANGESPACASVCPTNALTYGERQEIVKLAKERIMKDPSYVKHIYGEKEAGGTSWLYISDIPFEKLGFKTNLSEVALPKYTHDFIKLTPQLFLGGGALLTALSFYTKRRNDVSEDKKKKD